MLQIFNILYSVRIYKLKFLEIATVAVLHGYETLIRYPRNATTGWSTILRRRDSLWKNKKHRIIVCPKLFIISFHRKPDESISTGLYTFLYVLFGCSRKTIYNLVVFSFL